MTDKAAMSDVGGITELGGRPDEYHRHELPGREWLTCRGCPALRVFDWHYFYCRHLGDQTKPDRWNDGWKRIGSTTWESVEEIPCHRSALMKEKAL